MIKKYKSINEEINRIKSLFTEERMFGNLVEGGIREGVIKTGSKPDVVKPLQRLLKVEDDGIFGPETKEALMKFQSDNGLEDDGIAGEETVKVLNKKFKINESNYSVISEDTQSDLNAVNAEVAVEVGTVDPVDGCTKGNCTNGYSEYINDDTEDGSWSKYKGNYIEGDWSGYGFYENDEGDSYKGFFKGGIYEGIGVLTEDGVEKMGYFESGEWKRDLNDVEKVKLLELTNQTVESAVNSLLTTPEAEPAAEEQGGEGAAPEEQGGEETKKTHTVGNNTYDIELWTDIEYNLSQRTGDDIDYYIKVDKDGKKYGYRKKYERIVKGLRGTTEKNPDIQSEKISIIDDEENVQYLYVPVNTNINTDNTISDLKNDLEKGEKTLKETFKLCKEKLTDMSKISSKMSLNDYINKGNEDPTKTYEFCVGKFHSQLNRWDKLRGSKSSINELRDRWFSDIDHEKLKAKGGTLGQKYNIMDGSRKLGVVMKKGRDEYRIRTKMGEDIVIQSGGKAEFANPRAQAAVENAISMPDDKRIVLNKKLISKEDRIWASFTLQDIV
jgi:hypothetical protein